MIYNYSYIFFNLLIYINYNINKDEILLYNYIKTNMLIKLV